MNRRLSERKRELRHQDEHRMSDAEVTDAHWLALTEKLFLQSITVTGAHVATDEVERLARKCGRVAKIFYDSLCEGGQATLARDERKFGSGYPDPDYVPEPDPAPEPDRGVPQ